MYKSGRFPEILIIFFIMIILPACKSRKEAPLPQLFQALDYARTGLDFSNALKPSKDFNVFKYMYFYNGSGVGAGDFNNDGLIDLFFTSNQGQNKIYLNQGNLKFKDVTAEAKIPED